MTQDTNPSQRHEVQLERRDFWQGLAAGAANSGGSESSGGGMISSGGVTSGGNVLAADGSWMGSINTTMPPWMVGGNGGTGAGSMILVGLVAIGIIGGIIYAFKGRKKKKG